MEKLVFGQSQIVCPTRKLDFHAGIAFPPRCKNNPFTYPTKVTPIKRCSSLKYRDHDPVLCIDFYKCTSTSSVVAETVPSGLLVIVCQHLCSGVSILHCGGQFRTSSSSSSRLLSMIVNDSNSDSNESGNHAMCLIVRIWTIYHPIATQGLGSGTAADIR